MNEPFDPALLCLSRDPSGRLDMDGMKRLLSPLEVKADCIHCAVSIYPLNSQLADVMLARRRGRAVRAKTRVRQPSAIPMSLLLTAY